MKTIHGSIPALLALSLLSGCVSLPTTDPVELPSGQWTLDPQHNSVIWQVQHLGLSWYTARFDRAEARLDFDPANPEVAQLTAIVDTDSVSTGDRDFDETLRGRTWLDTGRYPQIVFQSTHIEVTGETTGRVHGTVTLKDQSFDAVMETEFYGGTFNLLERRQAIGFHGEISFDMTGLDMGGLGRRFIGDEIRISIEAEFLREGS